MGRGASKAFVAVVLACAVAACTGNSAAEEVGSGDRNPATSASSESTPDPSSGETSGTAARFTQPLVVIANVHRPRLDLTRRQAHELAAGLDDGVTSIDPRLRLVDGPDEVSIVRRDRSAIAVVPADEVLPTVRVARVAGIDPIRHPRAYRLTTAADDPLPTPTTLRFVGDIMLGRGVEAANRRSNPARVLRPYAPWLRAADLAVGNLESTLSTDGRPRQGDDSFAARPSVVPDLERAGFDLLTLANNHTGDYGPRALRQTLDHVDASGIARVGAGRDAAEAWSPVVLRRKGVAFGFLAFNAIGETPRATAHSPGDAEIRMQPRLGPLNHTDLRRMTRAIHRLKQHVDVVIVLPHWGDQYVHGVVPDQRKVARALVDAGADLVVGNHPHSVQGMSARGPAVVAYSLGNFVFDMDWRQMTMEGMALEVTFWGDRLMAATPEPYVLDARFAPHPADATSAHRILNDVWRFSFGVFKGRQLPFP
jgi:poly-gamma-glutamate capsule biosynthesis protein CapA/YwtB (metallophosphatase superfamily)